MALQDDFDALETAARRFDAEGAVRWAQAHGDDRDLAVAARLVRRAAGARTGAGDRLPAFEADLLVRLAALRRLATQSGGRVEEIDRGDQFPYVIAVHGAGLAPLLLCASLRPVFTAMVAHDGDALAHAHVLVSITIELSDGMGLGLDTGLAYGSIARAGFTSHAPARALASRWRATHAYDARPWLLGAPCVLLEAAGGQLALWLLVAQVEQQVRRLFTAHEQLAAPPVRLARSVERLRETWDATKARGWSAELEALTPRAARVIEAIEAHASDLGALRALGMSQGE